jgi:hypothetical protein
MELVRKQANQRKGVRTATSVQSGEHSTCTAERKFALTSLERSHDYDISLFSFGFKRQDLQNLQSWNPQILLFLAEN